MMREFEAREIRKMWLQSIQACLPPLVEIPKEWRDRIVREAARSLKAKAEASARARNSRR